MNFLGMQYFLVSVELLYLWSGGNNHNEWLSRSSINFSHFSLHEVMVVMSLGFSPLLTNPSIRWMELALPLEPFLAEVVAVAVVIFPPLPAALKSLDEELTLFMDLLHLWPGVPRCLHDDLLDVLEGCLTNPPLGELVLDTWRNSANAGFVSTSSFFTWRAMMILLSPQLGQVTTSCLGSPISNRVLLRLSRAILKGINLMHVSKGILWMSSFDAHYLLVGRRK